MPYTDSEAVTGSITFTGLWVHDPLDAAGTVLNLPYGSAQRGRAAGVEHVGTTFAGRSYPVFDYGEQLAETFQVRADVPHGTTWRTDLDALDAFATTGRNVHVRDGRGRSVTGAMSGYTETDQLWGTAVAWTVERAHEETVTAT